MRKTFDANDLYQGQNFSKVLSSLVTLNKVTAVSDPGEGQLALDTSLLIRKNIGLGSDSVCARPSSHRIKSFDSLGPQPSHGRTSKLFQGQYRSLDMTDNSNNQLVVRAKFNFQQTNEDELSFAKGDVIHVTRVEEGGWWEGTHSGRTGWFPSNYVREIKPSGEWPAGAAGGRARARDARRTWLPVLGGVALRVLSARGSGVCPRAGERAARSQASFSFHCDISTLK
ncbi:rho guanine nucleotide exchange factor 7-like isoform X2 [Physeter macrocephalus]|uniref:Rho guanine nucleotide exchange factor 7-like isoform X2 n=1 Tax=Physeter macrocephalus TaxID=9755 RepID=A0A9W2WJB2_PHYMC|nr:rho guanine nucleotide exchange factor 7-like isoform X2 [Physeter catodon]